GRGGATETVVPGETGVLTGEGVDAFAEGIRLASARTWSAEACRAQAERFSTERFVSAMHDATSALMTAPAAEARWESATTVCWPWRTWRWTPPQACWPSWPPTGCASTPA